MTDQVRFESRNATPFLVSQALLLGDVEAPSASMLSRVNEMLLRRYHLKGQDRQDVMAQALLDYVIAHDQVQASREGFFLVVARRRACDFWRRTGREKTLLAARFPSDLDGAQDDPGTLQEIAQRFVEKKPLRERCRTGQVVREILGGASFAEACRSAGIPRGSQGRYRNSLQKCFRKVLHPQSNEKEAEQS